MSDEIFSIYKNYTGINFNILFGKYEKNKINKMKDSLLNSVLFDNEEIININSMSYIGKDFYKIYNYKNILYFRYDVIEYIMYTYNGFLPGYTLDLHQKVREYDSNEKELAPNKSGNRFLATYLLEEGKMDFQHLLSVFNTSNT